MGAVLIVFAKDRFARVTLNNSITMNFDIVFILNMQFKLNCHTNLHSKGLKKWSRAHVYSEEYLLLPEKHLI